MLKVTSKHGSDFLALTQVSLCDKDLRQLLYNNRKRVPEPGSIVDKGTIGGKYRIFVYKFLHTRKCSGTSSEDFEFSLSASELVQPTSRKIDRNVAWAFYCLESDVNLDIDKDFISQENAVLRWDFVYPKPSSEDERMDCLHATIRNHYHLDNVNAQAKIRRVVTPGYTDGHCQFSGSGDIYI